MRRHRAVLTRSPSMRSYKLKASRQNMFGTRCTEEDSRLFVEGLSWPNARPTISGATLGFATATMQAGAATSGPALIAQTRSCGFRRL